MAGVMSGVMNAPLTSIFLIAELTNGYALFVPLMLVAALFSALDYYLEPYSIYTKKLSQSGELLTHNKEPFGTGIPRSARLDGDRFLPGLDEHDARRRREPYLPSTGTFSRWSAKTAPCWASFNWTTCGPICSLRKIRDDDRPLHDRAARPGSTRTSRSAAY